MAKTKISQFDAVASNNTDINSVNVAEGCPPSGINNAIREMASLLKKQEVGTDAMTSPDIDGGTIDGATIGANSATTGAFTNLSVSGAFTSQGIDDNADATAITIDSSERVGIGTSSPNGNGLLTLNAPTDNSPQIVFTENNTAKWLIGHRHDGDHFRFYDLANSAERMRIDSSGRVGIGTTPLFNTQINKSSTNTTLTDLTDAQLVLSNTGSATTNQHVKLGFRFQDGSVNGQAMITAVREANNSRSTALTLSTAPSSDGDPDERLRVDSSGNVGIGTSSPSNKLSISGMADITTTAASQGAIQVSGDKAYIQVKDPNSGGSQVDQRMWAYGNSNATNLAYFGTWSSHNIAFTTAGTERMRITSGGLVGINSSNPYSMLDVTSNTDGNTTITASANITSANNFHDFALGNREAYAVGIRRTLQQSTPAYLRPRMDFFVQALNSYLPADRTVAMTILDTKQVSIGVTSTLGNGRVAIDASDLIYCLICKANASNGAFILFQKDDGSTIGNIDHTATATRYVTSSDYRLKENVTYDFDATSRLKQLKPARFNFIADETNTVVDGFLAHEVSSIVPEAIRGEKDAVDEDGKIDPQGIDQSKIVPLLVKTIQELEARITTLEGA